MRFLLATAAALAPLMAAAGAHAEVVISTDRTTPIRTSNATGSAPDNIRLAQNGAIALTSGTAITIDSANSVDLDSGSQITLLRSASGSTAIGAVAGGSGDITVGGVIQVTDLIDSFEDTDRDGDLDGPWAEGENRFAIRTTGSSRYVGNILLENTGGITVQGNRSAGISVESGLIGQLTTLGAITVTGDQSYGVRTQGLIDSARIGGNITVTGAGSVGAAVDGDVAGRVTIQGTVASTGFRYPNRPRSREGLSNVRGEDLYLEDLDADDLLIGGPAVRIAGDVAGGLVLDRAPAYAGGGDNGDDDLDGILNGDEDDDGDGTPNRTDTDRDGDGVLDAQEGNAALAVSGSAPALLVGSDTRAITLGVAGTGDNAFGLINRGTINANGVYDDVVATAAQIGAGQAVSVSGGIRNEGTVAASSAEADARALRIMGGASTPLISNTGTLQSVVVTDGAHIATSLLIEAGASTPRLDNVGTIGATLGGAAGDAYGVRDLSGTLTDIVNARQIFATIQPDSGETITGRAVAIDVAANTTGVTILQLGRPRNDVYSDIDGDLIPDYRDDDDDNDGIPDAQDDADNDDDNDGVLDVDEPLISGAILFGSGADLLDVRDGTVRGDISFGAGADRLSITGGATVRGAITDSDGQLTIDVANGTLDALQTETLNLTSLNVGSNGTLFVPLDPITGSGGLNVSGTATLASGASLGTRFNSLVQGEQRLTLIQAGDLQAGAVDFSSISDNSPFLFNVQAQADTAANQVYVDVRRKSAAELGLIASETDAYDAVYDALGQNASLRNAFLAQSDREGLIDLYEQMLPEHGGGALMSLASGVDAVTRALTGRNEVLAPGQTSAWLQEINFYADKDKTDSYGFRSEGFGIAGGYERGTDLGNVGVSLAFTSSDIEDPESAAEENLAVSLVEMGLYWRAQGQYWTTWARAAAGYAFIDSTREIVSPAIALRTEADWNGYTLAAAGGVSYRRNFGRLEIRPELYAEYFWLQEDGYEESGAGDGFDLIVDDRTGHLFSATAAMNIGTRLGRDGWIRPELRVGWRQYISVDSGETVGRFSGSTQQFLLANGAVEGGGPIVGLRLGIGNDLGLLTVQADAESIDDYVRYSLLLRATFRF